MTGLLSAWREWRERRQILREVRLQSSDKREQTRFKVKDDLTYALAALERGDQSYASEVWSGLMERHPNVARASPLALKVLIGLRRFDEAETLLRVGQKAHPGDSFFAKGLAELAQAKRDFDTAIEHCTFLRKRFPGIVEGYTIGANACREKDQLGPAEELALQAIKRFPDHIGGPLEYANVAMKRQDWEDALRRWQPVREQFGYFGAYVGSAQALSHLGRYDEAEELLQQARYRFGTDPGPLREYARVAEAKGDVAEAIKRWNGVLFRFPLDMPVHLTASEAFERLGEPLEAEATLRAAIDRFPTESRPMLELAKFLLFKRRNYAAAVEAWAALRRAFPNNEEAYASGAEALRRAGRGDEAEILREEHRVRFRS